MIRPDIVSATGQYTDVGIVIVTGHRDLRLSLGDIINRESGLTIGAAAADLPEAWRLLDQGPCKLAIVDWLTVCAAERVGQVVFPKWPDMPVLVMSMDNSQLAIEIMLSCRVRGLVTKHDLAEELLPAIRELLAGRLYFSSEFLTGLSLDARERLLSGGTADQNPEDDA